MQYAFYKTRQDKTRQDKTRQTNYGLIKLGFVKKLFIVLFLQFTFYLLTPQPIFAYSTNMSASVEIGQPNFTSSGPNQNGSANANTVSDPRMVAVCNNKLILGDRNNNRVLIWNSIPTTNNQSADVVIGQTNFTNTSNNQGGSAGANTLRRPSGITCVGQKLIVGDLGNNRVLIYNQIPTSNNASADVVIGQQNFTSTSANQGGSCASNTLSGTVEMSVYSDGQKLYIADSNNSRVLIYNSIPTSNNASADVVLGQTNFTSCSSNRGGSAEANTLASALRNVYSDGEKLYVSDYTNSRVLIWNSIPTTNGVSADVVIGQQNFTSTSANQGGSASSSTLNFPIGLFVQNKRLFIGDALNSRILIYNSIPSVNNTSADIVIGQQNFTSTSANQGGSVAASTFNHVRHLFIQENKLIATDENHRVLIFDNIIKQPGLTLNNSPEGRESNQIRLSGTASVDSPYTLKSVEFSINGGSFSGATATDGSFDETSDNFYFDFNPTSNRPKDSNGNLIDGYTVRVRSTNNNADVTDRLFYFTPFDLLGPSDNATVSTSFPTFSFAVNRQRSNLRDNLSKYQVQVRKGGSDSTANWQTVVDDIPIDFSTIQTSDTNLQKNTYVNRDPNNGNGVYETTKFIATYSVDSSHVQVTSKVLPMSGTYQWKIVAADKAGHSQEAGARNLYVNATSTAITNNFSLAVLNISGLGNPYINSYNPGGIKSIYYTSSSNPVFFGIAWTNSKVTLKLTDQNCKTDCIRTYSTTANSESRYGINIPKGDLSYGKKYTANLSVALGDKYNELPQFTLSLSRPTASTLGETTSSVPIESQLESTIAPTPIPTTVPISTPTPKKCLWFICF